jgi:hypothetical protein
MRRFAAILLIPLLVADPALASRHKALQWPRSKLPHIQLFQSDALSSLAGPFRGKFNHRPSVRVFVTAGRIAKSWFKRKKQDSARVIVAKAPVLERIRAEWGSQWQIFTHPNWPYVLRVAMTEQQTRVRLWEWGGAALKSSLFLSWVQRVHRGKTEGIRIVRERLANSQGIYPIVALQDVGYRQRLPNGQIEEPRLPTYWQKAFMNFF